MGRAAGWLAEQRPAMVEILAEMERNSSYTVGGAARGDLGLLLACLSHVAAGTGGRPRSIPAMRQAWWRWTTNGPQAATPPVQELALMVRHAKNHGWLRQLTRPDCLSLVSRLMTELEESRATERRALEVAWGPTARIAVEGLVDFLEARIAKRAEEEGGSYWGAAFPAALVVQQEVSTMLKEVIERVLRSLGTPREVFKAPHETDSFFQPFEGWPEALRALASDLSQVLNGAAKEFEEFEASLIPSSSVGGPRRKKLFGPPSAENEEQ